MEKNWLFSKATLFNAASSLESQGKDSEEMDVIIEKMKNVPAHFRGDFNL